MNFTVGESPIFVTIPAITMGITVISMYANIVFMRATYMSTLLAYTLRKLLRLYSMLHIAIGLWELITTGCSFFIPNVKGARHLLIIYLNLRETILCAPTCILFERILYDISAKMRDNPPKCSLSCLRIVAIILPIIPTCVLTGMLIRENITYLFEDYRFIFIHGGYEILTLSLILILSCLLKQKTKKYKMATGMKNDNRRAKLKAEKQMLLRLIVPIFLISAIFTAIEAAIPYLQLIEGDQIIIYMLLINSFRLLVMPLTYSLFHSGIRDDFKAHFFIWRKVHRRSSETKVREIASKQSQETIITNFKMIGILSDA